MSQTYTNLANPPRMPRFMRHFPETLWANILAQGRIDSSRVSPFGEAFIGCFLSRCNAGSRDTAGNPSENARELRVFRLLVERVLQIVEERQRAGRPIRGFDGERPRKR